MLSKSDLLELVIAGSIIGAGTGIIMGGTSGIVQGADWGTRVARLRGFVSGSLASTVTGIGGSAVGAACGGFLGGCTGAVAPLWLSASAVWFLGNAAISAVSPAPAPDTEPVEG